ncbi:MAG: 4-hydroxy-3-methylbut-2-enyl diphosphate reductase [Vicinamibacterales bacterium]
MPPLIFRKGLDLKHAVADVLAESYHSDLIETIKADGYSYRSGRLEIRLAREFGFCYGVDRAVDYAYQTRKRFPDRPVLLTGEIIHNPHVNDELRAQGIRFLSDPGESLEALTPNDVVILPAFGVTTGLLEALVQKECTLVDTTCGSVLNVWKNVKRYAQDGFTSVIHGKQWHEETRATASQAVHAGGHYLVVLDREEADLACRFITEGGQPEDFLAQFTHAVSPGFSPERDLRRVGCANQTTMLSTESLAIGTMFQHAMSQRYGADALADHFRAFDTICSATQDRQDAVIALLDERLPDLMLVVGGYNSSNTYNLARICALRVPTLHIADAGALVSRDAVRHMPLGEKTETIASQWLPVGTPVTIGLTSGASTPDNIVGDVVRRLETLVNER